MDDEGEIMTTAEVAAFLQVSPITVKNWRWKKMGPPFFAIEGSHHVRYRRSALRAWVEAQELRQSPRRLTAVRQRRRGNSPVRRHAFDDTPVVRRSDADFQSPLPTRRVAQ